MSKGQQFYDAYVKAVALWVDDYDFIPRMWEHLTSKEQAVCEYAAEFYEEAKNG